MESSEVLIFDLGFHRGEDSHYYLACGHKVVAIEADPVLFSEGLQLFGDAITSGKLILLHRAVIGTNRKINEVSFYPNPSNSEWGTTDDRWMRRNEMIFGKPHGKETKVLAITLPELVVSFGHPRYVKIDIEGNDDEVLSDIQLLEKKPDFVSWETGKESLSTVIKQHLALYRQGYSRFKTVQQEFQHITKRTNLPDGTIYSFMPACSGPIPSEYDSEWTTIHHIIFKYTILFLTYKLIGPRSFFSKAARSKRPFLSFLPQKIKSWTRNKNIPFPGWYDSHAWRP